MRESLRPSASHQACSWCGTNQPAPDMWQSELPPNRWCWSVPDCRRRACARR